MIIPKININMFYNYAQIWSGKKRKRKKGHKKTCFWRTSCSVGVASFLVVK